MDDVDEISKLEELLAAEGSDEEKSDIEDNTKDNCSKSKQPLFLQEVVETEKLTVSTLKRSSQSNGKPENREASINCNTEKSRNNQNSLIHTGDTDSSDDEEKKNCLERKYSDYGLGVKKILHQKQEEKETFVRNSNFDTRQSSSFKINKSILPKEPKKETKEDIYQDPVFGMRIIRPLISSSVLKERMQGREAITMDRVKRHIAHGDLSKDWVIAGAIVRKSASKESQKGSQYCIWTLCDLKNDLKTVAVFLFRNAYKQLWKTSQGMVVGILNPSILDKKDESTDQACLSVDNPDRVMIFGNSKDFGFCKSRKKNGDPCTTFVNIAQCEYCIYHVKQEYQKCSRRSELQPNTPARGLFDLRNKVLGKNTVIYGGKSFSAIPAAKSGKLMKRDNNRLMTLSDHFKPVEQPNNVQQSVSNRLQQPGASKSPVSIPVKRLATRVEVSTSQRLKDLDRLEFLRAGSSQSNDNKILLKESLQSPINEKVLKQSILQEHHNTDSSKKLGNQPIVVPTLGIPMLGFGLKKSSTVDLTIPFSKKHADRAKVNALKWIKHNGPLNKNDPNNIRGTMEGKKRSLSILNASSDGDSNTENEPTPKKPKTGVASENFQKMLAATSAHTDLIVQHDDSEADKYFNKLEKKEMMEEKMLKTYKVACKAVRCLKCSYTSFSAADRCKEEKHPLKVFDTMKRFFKCSHCGNRQVSLELIPTNSCRNCNSMSWQKTGMIAEKKALTLASKLSITGEEEFLGHVEHGADINLLVPE